MRNLTRESEIRNICKIVDVPYFHGSVCPRFYADRWSLFSDQRLMPWYSTCTCVWGRLENVSFIKDFPKAISDDYFCLVFATVQARPGAGQFFPPCRQERRNLQRVLGQAARQDQSWRHAGTACGKLKSAYICKSYELKQTKVSVFPLGMTRI